ncbi:MAG: hypothetical protein LAO51_11510 [Acidobacteriia bacterium]|nr:hypothetical protein [Terriglobia bacterium]
MRPLPICLAAVIAGGSALARSGPVDAGFDRAAATHPTMRRTVPVAPTAPEVSAAAIDLVYFGGPVLSGVEVLQVIWGSGTYLDGVANGGTTTSTRLGDFYHAVTLSPYLDWLCEYDTHTQAIGRGGFGGTIKITPSAANGGSTVTDDQIQSELVAQIGAGALPFPGANTLYMIDFPAGTTILLGSSRSCVDFCGYHGTGSVDGQFFYYAVLPNFTAGSGCALGCGRDPTLFNDLTSTASHEMVEAITDPAVGVATVFGPPLSWYDPINGEIGDICNQIHSNLAGSDGVTYVVQNEWSDALAGCIAQKPNHAPIAQCHDVTVSVFGCTASASIDNDSHDPDCWDTLSRSPSPAGPYPAGLTQVRLTVTDSSGASSSCSANVTVSSIGCDDGIACTTGDACSGSACAGIPGPPPKEVDDRVVLSRSAGVDTIHWDVASGATASDVLVGLISALPSGFGGADERCLGGSLTSASASDSSIPPVGEGFWYLVRGKSFCGNGTYGFEAQNGSSTLERVSGTCH